METYLFCYHGTIKRDGLAIQQNIDLSKARYRTDFGKGFYLTDNLKQAQQWAVGRAKDSMGRGGNSDDFAPVVVYFQLDLKKLYKLTCKSFNEPSKEWAEFIYNCRIAGLKKELFHQYDYTVGPLADGRTSILVQEMNEGLISLDEFSEGIQPYHHKSSQMAMHTAVALDSLKIVGVKEIDME